MQQSRDKWHYLISDYFAMSDLCFMFVCFVSAKVVGYIVVGYVQDQRERPVKQLYFLDFRFDFIAFCIREGDEMLIDHPNIRSSAGHGEIFPS